MKYSCSVQSPLSEPIYRLLKSNFVISALGSMSRSVAVVLSRTLFGGLVA